jgi:PAS domain S-box-containing protein
VGYSRDELLGKTFLDITHPEDLTASITAVRQLLSGEISSWETEKRYNRKDGITIWAKLFLSLVRDEHNQARYFIAILEDITQRIEGAQALRQAEQRLMLAQSAAHLGVWYRDWGTNVISVSGEYSRLHGLAPDRVTVTQEEWICAIHPDDRERVEALRRESRERTHSFNAEYRVRRPDGIVHWLLAKGAVLLNDSGRPIGTTGVIMDISERKQGEAALRESEERFRRVFEEGPLGVALVRKDYGFEKVNSALCQMVGYGEAELVQMSFVDITHPDDVRSDVELAERLFRGEITFYRIQKRYVKKSGENHLDQPDCIDYPWSGRRAPPRTRDGRGYHRN